MPCVTALTLNQKVGPQHWIQSKQGLALNTSNLIDQVSQVRDRALPLKSLICILSKSHPEGVHTVVKTQPSLNGFVFRETEDWAVWPIMTQQ